MRLAILPALALAALSTFGTVFAQDDGTGTDGAGTDTGTEGTDTGTGTDPSASPSASASDPAATGGTTAPATIETNATVTPSEPSGNTVVNVDMNLTAKWGVDQTGFWSNMKIQLMSGSNTVMLPVTTVADGIDGTTVAEYSFQIPNVSPYSKIYFLQFTNPGANPVWTTRFTIAGRDGSTVPPPQTLTDASGNQVGWGNGTLGDGATATAITTAGVTQTGVNGTGMTLYTQGINTATGLPAGVATTGVAAAIAGSGAVSLSEYRPVAAVAAVIAAAAFLV